MIARIAVTPSALLELGSGQPPRRAKEDHDRLLRAIRSHGSLSFSSNQAATYFIRTIRQRQAELPNGAAKRWLELLGDLRSSSRVRPAQPPVQVSDGATLRELADSWGEEADVVVMDEPHCSALGVERDLGFVELTDMDFEVTVPDAAWDCSHFRRYQKLIDERGIRCGTRRDDFWDDVLGPLARNSRRAIVVDRYLFRYLWREQSQEHAAWLLHRLASERGFGGQVDLISEALEGASAAQTLALLRKVWHRPDTSRSLSVVVCLTKSDAHVLPHDRHIRFDGGAVGLGAGFDRLARPKIRDKDGLTWDFRWDKEPIDRLRTAEQRCLRDERSDLSQGPW